MTATRKVKVGDWVITDIDGDDSGPDFLRMNPPRQIIEVINPIADIVRTFMCECPHEADFAHGEKETIGRSQLIAIFDSYESALEVYTIAEQKLKKAINVYEAIQKSLLHSVINAALQANGTPTINEDGRTINV